MKISLDKQLEKRSQEEKKKYDVSHFNETKLLTNQEDNEDARILRGLSNVSQFNRIEEIRGEMLDLENIEKKFGGKVYKISQIEELAIDYNLRFLPSKRYTGSFDNEVTKKIKEFAHETNTSIDNYSLSNYFYILAPKNMFTLTDEKYVTKKQLDPALFYRIDNDHFRLIHKWGDDFTIFRLLSGFRFRSWWAHQIFNTIMVLPVVTFILGLMFGPHHVSNHWLSITLLGVIISFGFSYFRWGWGKHDEGNQINRFFSPYNWDSQKNLTR